MHLTATADAPSAVGHAPDRVVTARAEQGSRPAAAPRARSLRTLLLFDLGFLSSSAVLMVGFTTAVLAGVDLISAALPLAFLWLASTAVFVLFGLRLIRRLVLRPIEVLAGEAAALADGRFDFPAADLGTATELRALQARYRGMAADLLDAQSQLVRVEKLAGIGRLAAGVAHEIRNPLSALGTYTEVLGGRGADPEITAQMRHAVERIERTVQSLLDYSRPRAAADAGRVPVGAAVRTAVDFLESQGILRNVTLGVDIEPGLPEVAGDRHALEQVAVNLLVNARDAAPGGTIMVGVRRRRLEPRDRASRRRTDTTGGPPPDREFVSRPRRPDVPQGTLGVFVFVADDGPGIPAEDRERVFDPFFTTKDPGEGTGLGLAIVARTVHEHGGIVWADRAREGGAAIKIFLPAAEQRCAS